MDINCVVEKLRELLYGSTVSKFSTVEQCKGFREGVLECISIIKEMDSYLTPYCKDCPNWETTHGNVGCPLDKYFECKKRLTE